MGLPPRLNNSSYLSKSRLFFCNALKQIPAIKVKFSEPTKISNSQTISNTGKLMCLCWRY